MFWRVIPDKIWLIVSLYWSTPHVWRVLAVKIWLIVCMYWSTPHDLVFRWDLVDYCIMSSKRGLLFLLLLPLITSTSENKSPADAEKRVQYILYDVNPGEGFNLRRDVYMRMAVFVKKLNKAFPQSYWVLVLPPWGHLYHWQSRQLGHQVLR